MNTRLSANGGKIGIFDSGLGGLVIAQAIFKLLPQYEYVYLGDTKNLPYGEKKPSKIYSYTKEAVEFLFAQNCELVIIACNTSSALALRKIQQNLLPKKYPGKRVLGVVIPTLEEADKHHSGKTLGVIATSATVKSHIYAKELKKIDSAAKVIEIATPKLVTLIEQNSLPSAKNALKLYLEPLFKKGVSTLILGCTHYPILKKLAKKTVGKNVLILSQDEIIPKKLKAYLKRHGEIEKKLLRSKFKKFFVTKMNKNFNQVAKRLFGKKINFLLAKY